MIELLLPAILVLFLSILFSMLGLGGASVFVPIFFWLGMPFEQAIVLGLFVNVISTAVASSIFWRHGLLSRNDLKHSVPIVAGIAIAIPFGVAFSQLAGQKLLVGAFAVALLISAAMLFFGFSRHKKNLSHKLTARETTAAGIMGAIAGVANGALGIGGGVFLVPSLIWAGTAPKKAAVISIACTLFASVLGLFGHIFFLEPNLPLFALVGICALVGSAAGSMLLACESIKNDTIKKAFILLLLLFAIKLLFDYAAL